MWSRTQNYPLDNNDDQISIINRFFDFINNTRRLNNRIIEQNDNLAEMGYEIVVAFIYASRNNNSNTNTTSSRSNTTSSRSNNNNNNVSSTTTNINTPTRNNTSRRRSRNRVVSSSTRGVSSRYTSMRNDWRNANRNNLRNLWQRNVRPRNNTNNTNTNNSNNLSRNPIQSPLPNIIPMFGPLSFQPTNNSALEQLFQQSLQSVPIRPSTEQIERATEERIFNQIVQPINDTCPITRNRFNDNDTVLQVLECRHCFNPTSLRRWFETSVRCPICRYDIREYNPLNVIHNPYRNNENDIENPITDTQDVETPDVDTQDAERQDTQTEDTQDDDDNVTEDTTSSQDIARELVMNELDNINNDPQITEEQRNLANIISQSMNNPTTNQELIQTETSIDSHGNLNLTYQFGLNLPQQPP